MKIAEDKIQVVTTSPYLTKAIITSIKEHAGGTAEDQARRFGFDHFFKKPKHKPKVQATRHRNLLKRKNLVQALRKVAAMPRIFAAGIFNREPYTGPKYSLLARPQSTSWKKRHASLLQSDQRPFQMQSNSCTTRTINIRGTRPTVHQSSDMPERCGRRTGIRRTNAHLPGPTLHTSGGPTPRLPMTIRLKPVHR